MDHTAAAAWKNGCNSACSAVMLGCRGNQNARVLQTSRYMLACRSAPHDSSHSCMPWGGMHWTLQSASLSKVLFLYLWDLA